MKRQKKSADRGLAVAYIRVSTEDQALGPEAQRQAIEAWAAREGVRLLATHEDLGVSGSAALDRRPGLLAAFAAVEQHRAGLLVVARRDRLARDVATALAIDRLAMDYGAEVVTVEGDAGNDPNAWILRTMKDMLAQYELMMIRLRTKAALQVKRSRGERVGTVPYGFRLAADGRQLEQDLAEQAVINLVQALAADGLSQRAVAEELNRRGFRSRTGGPFGKTQIARLLGRQQAA